MKHYQSSSSLRNYNSSVFLLSILIGVILFSIFNSIQCKKDERILIGGDFKSTTSSPLFKHNTASVNISHLAMVNMDQKTIEPYYSKPPNGPVHVVHYEPRCDYLFIGGAFTEINGITTGPIAVKKRGGSSLSNETEWTSLSVFNEEIYIGQWTEGAIVKDIKVYYTNILQDCSPTIIITGSFTKAAGIENVNNIIMLDTVSLEWFKFPYGEPKQFGVSGKSVNSVQYGEDGFYYVGGDFGGYFKRYNFNTKTWETLMQGQIDGPISTIYLLDNHAYEDVYIVGGEFKNPKKYLFVYKPSISTNYARPFKVGGASLSENQKSSQNGITSLTYFKDFIYFVGSFQYINPDNETLSNYLVTDLVGDVEDSGDIADIYKKGNPFSINICKPPFDGCKKGSTVIAHLKNEKTVSTCVHKHTVSSTTDKTETQCYDFPIHYPSNSIKSIMFVQFSSAISHFTMLSLFHSILFAILVSIYLIIF